MKIYFAPLHGITTYTYRNLFDDLFEGVDKYYAPFLSASTHDMFTKKEIQDLSKANNNLSKPLVPQLLGSEGELFIDAMERLVDMGFEDEINLNMGCPSGTVVAKNRGSGCFKDLYKLEKTLEEIYTWNDNREKPLELSIKTRIGLNEESEWQEILDIYNKFPVSELIIHPRTRKQMYRENPNMDAFDYGYNNAKAPVCYNGDIKTIDDYKKIVDKYDVDAVMLGRGLVGNPMLASVIKGGSNLTRSKLIEYHSRIYEEYRKEISTDKHLLCKMKEFWTYVGDNFEDEHKVKKLIRKTQKCYKYNEVVNEILENYTLKL